MVDLKGKHDCLSMSSDLDNNQAKVLLWYKFMVGWLKRKYDCLSI